MKNTKLIIVEGIPGSGKTSAAKYIKELLDNKGIDNKLFLEGNLDHPADFESTACLSDEELNNLFERFQNYSSMLQDYVVKKSNDNFINYGKLRNEKGDTLPEDLYKEISGFDVCDGLSLEKYHELTLQRWTEFVHKAEKENCIYIFECCFIQNPAVVMLARHCADKNYIINHVLQLETITEKLNPQLIYYYQDSVRETISRVAEARDEWWINFVINYISNQTYGKKLNLSGFDGVVKFFEDRRDIELEIMEKLNIDRILLDNSEYNWECRYEEIKQFIAGRE